MTINLSGAPSASRAAIDLILARTSLGPAVERHGDTLNPRWSLSSGERELWAVCRSFVDPGAGASLLGCAQWLDADCKRVLLDALAMSFGLVAAEPEPVVA